MATKYFQNFDPVYYSFGDGEDPVLFNNISLYVDIIDQLKSNAAFYQDYTIVSGERPDTTSFRLYGTPEYYWTFFLLNDKLRESGWPVNNREMLDRAKKAYPHRYIVTKDDIATEPFDFPVGKSVFGRTSDTVGTIVKRNLDLNQLIIDTSTATTDVVLEYSLTINSNGFGEIEVEKTNHVFHSPSIWNVYKDGVLLSSNVYSIELSRLKDTATLRNVPYEEGSTYSVEASVFVSNPSGEETFTVGEEITYQVDGITIAGITVDQEGPQYYAVHHYEDANGETYDVDPFAQFYSYEVDGGGNRVRVENDLTTDQRSLYTAVTYYDRIIAKNDDLKQIKIIKPDAIVNVATEFYRLLAQ
jgi:hypothetical protein